jgi:hypothetical protein
MADQTFTIQVDAREVLSFFETLSRQTPFAVSKAINALMVHGQGIVQAQLSTEFTLRRKTFIERTVKVRQWANKRALIAEIGIDPTRDFLAKFEEGGRKRPIDGTALAVPIAVRRNKPTGLVIKNMALRSLQLRKHRTSGGMVQLKGLQRTFAVKGPTGGAVLQRVGRKGKGTATLAEEIARGSVRVVYAFKRSVPIPANLHFIETFQRDANAWPQFMEAAWAEAQATAR